MGLDVLFVNLSHPLATKIISSFKRKKDHRKLLKAKIKRKIDPEIRFVIKSQKNHLTLFDLYIHLFLNHSSLINMSTLVKLANFECL